jgi:hypothetical protein
MRLSKVHFKSNLHIFPYLETEVMTSANFFSPKKTFILAYLKELIFLNKFCEEKNLLSGLNRDDCESLIILFYTYFIIF